MTTQKREIDWRNVTENLLKGGITIGGHAAILFGIIEGVDYLSEQIEINNWLSAGGSLAIGVLRAAPLYFDGYLRFKPFYEEKH